MNIQTGHLRHQKNFSSHFLGGKERFLCFVDAEVNNQSNEVSEIQKKTEELLDGLREKMQGKESLNVEEIHTVLTAKFHSQFSREHIKKEIKDAQKRLYATDKSDKNNDDNLQATEFGEFAKEIFFEEKGEKQSKPSEFKENLSANRKITEAINAKEEGKNENEIVDIIKSINLTEYKNIPSVQLRELFLIEKDGKYTVNLYETVGLENGKKFQDAYLALGMYDFWKDMQLENTAIKKWKSGSNSPTIGAFGINKNKFPVYLEGKPGFMDEFGLYEGVKTGDSFEKPTTELYTKKYLAKQKEMYDKRTDLKEEEKYTHESITSGEAMKQLKGWTGLEELAKDPKKKEEAVIEKQVSTGGNIEVASTDYKARALNMARTMDSLGIKKGFVKIVQADKHNLIPITEKASKEFNISFEVLIGILIKETGFGTKVAIGDKNLENKAYGLTQMRQDAVTDTIGIYPNKFRGINGPEDLTTKELQIRAAAAYLTVGIKKKGLSGTLHRYNANHDSILTAAIKAKKISEK